jgi:hypothetical protein
MAGGPNEIKASMNPQIRLLRPLGLLLLSHIRLMLVVDEVDDGAPRVAVVDVVSEARGVDHGELDAELLLFEFGLDDLDLGELVELLLVSSGVVLGGGELGGEEGVDEGGFAEAGFTCVNSISVLWISDEYR